VPSVRIFAAWASLVGGMLGLFVERWLFFAEARHTVIAFYGR
jgi:DMSO reductase anchor subunit